MRAERRESMRTPVDFFVQASRGETATLLPAIDVSATGLYLLAGDDHGAVDAERELWLEFTLPSGHTVETAARIAYLDDRLGQRGLAVQFSALDPRDREALRRFVEVSSAARARLG